MLFVAAFIQYIHHSTAAYRRTCRGRGGLRPVQPALPGVVLAVANGFALRSRDKEDGSRDFREVSERAAKSYQYINPALSNRRWKFSGTESTGLMWTRRRMCYCTSKIIFSVAKFGLLFVARAFRCRAVLFCWRLNLLVCRGDLPDVGEIA